MFCVNCGVKLADTEKMCPLCNTVVYHPDIQQGEAYPLYPQNKIPKAKPQSKALNGVVIFLFFIPILVSLLSDWQGDRTLSWSWLVVGALILGYIMFGLPLWFRNPNPVIFVPCSLAAAIIYLLYINIATSGSWFLNFAFPVAGSVSMIVSTLVVLLHYLKRGRLYIWGGAFVATGIWMLLVELLLDVTFNIGFIGWSIYPLIVCVLLGVTLTYLAINRSAREVMERKFFI